MVALGSVSGTDRYLKTSFRSSGGRLGKSRRGVEDILWIPRVAVVWEMRYRPGVDKVQVVGTQCNVVSSWVWMTI
jgi:hypothetical protein